MQFPNLKSLTVSSPSEKLSTVIHIPALQRLSSLQISSEYGGYRLFAEGDEITLTLKASYDLKDWESLTDYANPVIRHIRLYDGLNRSQHAVARNPDNVVALLMANVQTLEVGYSYLQGWYTVQ